MRLDNVTFCYTKIQEPSFKYKSTTEKEWSVDCVVTEDQADDWNDTYSKQTAKVIKTADFEGIYKIPAPYPDERKQFVIKLRKPCQYEDKITKQLVPVADKYRPRVFTRNKDGSLNDITMDTLIANGSTGSVSFEVNDSPEYGMSARLKAILVTDLIEYVPVESTSGVADDFGGNVVNEASKEFQEEAEAPKVAKARAKPAPRKAAPEFEEGDDAPFN